jgi:hypothetical protein
VYSNSPGVPGLVFDDFDQLYTQILSTENLGVGTKVKNNLKLKPLEEIKTQQNVENRTNLIIDFISTIDRTAILAIQNQTAELYDYEEDTKWYIQRVSNVFRREGCLREIRTTFKSLLEKKVKTKDTNCSWRFSVVKIAEKLAF